LNKKLSKSLGRRTLPRAPSDGQLAWPCAPGLARDLSQVGLGQSRRFPAWRSGPEVRSLMCPRVGTGRADLRQSPPRRENASVTPGSNPSRKHVGNSPRSHNAVGWCRSTSSLMGSRSPHLWKRGPFRVVPGVRDGLSPAVTHPSTSRGRRALTIMNVPLSWPCSRWSRCTVTHMQVCALLNWNAVWCNPHQQQSHLPATNHSTRSSRVWRQGCQMSDLCQDLPEHATSLCFGNLVREDTFIYNCSLT